MPYKIALDLRPLQSQSSHARRGIGRWLSEFILALAQKDQESHYVILWEGWDSPPALFRHQSTLRLPRKLRGIRWLSDYLLTPLYVKLARSDIYFTADYMAYPYHMSNTVLISLVYDFMPLTLPEYKWRTRLGCRLNFKNLRTHDHVFVISEYTLQEASQHLAPPLPSMSKIGVGVNHDRFVPASAEKIEAARKRWGVDKYLLYVGAPNPRKNLVRLIQAVDALSEEIPLILVGQGLSESQELLTAIPNMRHPERIKMNGFVEDDELVSLISGAFAMVFPSLSEGFGFPVLEAMACGTPVITSNCSALPEAAGHSALLVDPTSVSDIVEAITQLNQSDELRDRMVQHGLQRAASFSWEKCAETFLQNCDTLMKNKSHSQRQLVHKRSALSN